MAKGSAATQYGNCCGGGPSGKQVPAASKLSTRSAEHAASQQQPGVHVPLSKAQMQLVLRLAAASGVSGTSVQSMGYCWNDKAASTYCRSVDTPNSVPSSRIKGPAALPPHGNQLLLPDILKSEASACADHRCCSQLGALSLQNVVLHMLQHMYIDSSTTRPGLGCQH